MDKPSQDHRSKEISNIPNLRDGSSQGRRERREEGQTEVMIDQAVPLVPGAKYVKII